MVVREANVYGVSVSGHEGRAGMAALVLGKEGEDEQQQQEHTSIPSVAVVQRQKQMEREFAFDEFYRSAATHIQQLLTPTSQATPHC